MPLQTIICENAEYQLITANKVHEPFYREKLSDVIKEKYGTHIKREDMLSALQDTFDFYADEIQFCIRAIKDVAFFIYAYFLHEQTAELSYKTQDEYNLPVDYHYFVLYRRVLKMILQESCLLDLQPAKRAPDGEWIKSNVFLIEKLIYLGHCLFDQVEAISEEKITNGSIEMTFEKGLITFINSKPWDNYLPSLSQHFLEDGRNSIIDSNLQSDFNRRIKPELGIDLEDIERILASLNNDLQNREPPVLCTLKEFIGILKQNSASPFIEPFINGLILNRQNVTSIKSAATSPYTGKRIIHKPILTLTIDGTECILTEQFSFWEAMNTFFQNNITLGKIPAEWENIGFMDKISIDYKAHHKDILENPVEELLKENHVDYVRNVKTLLARNGKHLSINNTPGEIDFIFIYKDTIYLTDSKNLTKRYEMHGYYQDISKFTEKYNPKMKEKLEFFARNFSKLQEHLQIKLNKPDLDLSGYKLEGLFVINTPTIYTLDSDYKIYTYHRFNLFLNGDDFYTKYIEWADGSHSKKIGWPFIRNLKKVLKEI